MGKLYDAKMMIQKVIEQRSLDMASTNGSIGLKAGVLLALVKPETPDDPVKIEKLKSAAKEVLGITV